MNRHELKEWITDNPTRITRVKGDLLEYVLKLLELVEDVEPWLYQMRDVLKATGDHTEANMVSKIIDRINGDLREGGHG
jgi:hypothetical protein